jgi:hypothetical protein
MEIRRRPPNPKVKVAHLEYAVPHAEGEPRHILEEIVWAKDREVSSARERVSLEQLRQQLEGLQQAASRDSTPQVPAGRRTRCRVRPAGLNACMA